MSETPVMVFPLFDKCPLDAFSLLYLTTLMAWHGTARHGDAWPRRYEWKGI